MSALALRLVRTSQRLRRSLDFVVSEDGLRIPIARGTGLKLLNSRFSVETQLHAAYGIRRGSFVDVGANIGRNVLAMRRVDPAARYFGFEPLLTAALYVQRLIQENGLEETHSIFPVGLSDHVGRAEIMLNHDVDVSASMSDAVRPSTMYQSRVSVAVTTGDVMLDGVDDIGVVKIDAEGLEVEVLEGLRGTLGRHRPVLILEIMPYDHLEDGSYDRDYLGDLPEIERKRLITNRRRHGEALEALLHELDYRLCRLEDGEIVAAGASEATLAEQDFLAVPQEDLPSSARMG